MTNLTSEDLKRIETIEAFLQEFARKYNYDAPVDNFTPYQPIDTTEGEQGQGKNRTCNNNCSDVCGECQPAAKDEYSPFGAKLKDAIDTTEGEPIETEQRWSVNVRPMRHNFNDHKITIYLDNGVLSITEAQKAAEAIKQYLSANKF